MQLKKSHPLLVAASTSLLYTGVGAAQVEPLKTDNLHSSPAFSEIIGKRTESPRESDRSSIPSIRKLVNKMIVRRNQMDICDKGTGKCK